MFDYLIVGAGFAGLRYADTLDPTLPLCMDFLARDHAFKRAARGVRRDAGRGGAAAEQASARSPRDARAHGLVARRSGGARVAPEVPGARAAQGAAGIRG